MKASIQNIVQEFKAVVFKKDELDFRDMSDLKTLLPLPPSQEFNSDVEIKFQDI